MGTERGFWVQQGEDDDFRREIYVVILESYFVLEDQSNFEVTLPSSQMVTSRSSQATSKNT